jgi:hypothetical protein
VAQQKVESSIKTCKLRSEKAFIKTIELSKRKSRLNEQENLKPSKSNSFPATNRLRSSFIK